MDLSSYLEQRGAASDLAARLGVPPVSVFHWAREEQADGFADEIIDIADSVTPETGEVAKAKLQIDARKWKASKLAPKKYGEKLELDADMRVKVETRSLEDIFK